MLTLPFSLLLFRQTRGRHGDGSFVLTYIAKGGMCTLYPVRTSTRSINLLTIRCLVPIKSSGGKVNICTGNGTSYSRIIAVAPGTVLEYVASAFNGWQAVKIGSQVGWVSGDFSEITTE